MLHLKRRAQVVFQPSLVTPAFVRVVEFQECLVFRKAKPNRWCIGTLRRVVRVRCGGRVFHCDHPSFMLVFSAQEIATFGQLTPTGEIKPPTTGLRDPGVEVKFTQPPQRCALRGRRRARPIEGVGVDRHGYERVFSTRLGWRRFGRLAPRCERRAYVARHATAS